VSAVGSGVVALRLRQADLPIEPVVALMSAEHRFAIGAGILIAPLLAGFIGFMADWVAHLLFPDYRQRKVLAAVTVLAGGALVYGILRPPITGGYITSTEHSVVLSPHCEVTEAVPRDQIERISVGPDEVTRSHC
jgi:hypothetical protein